MRKRIYRTIPVKALDVQTLMESVNGGRVIIAVDVAKQDMVAAIAGPDARVLRTVRWKSPGENGDLVDVATALQQSGLCVEAVMESTGSYGDVLRHRLAAASVPTYRVSAKRSHDAAEVYDGVPSLHDAKSAAILVKLHLDGASRLWNEPSKEVQQLKAAVRTMDLYQGHYLRCIHRLEPLLAQHFPELPQVLPLTGATILALLGRIGGPQDVAVRPNFARRLMTGISHKLLAPAKIDRVIELAATSQGVPMLAQQRASLMELASEAHRTLKAFKNARGRAI